MVKAAEDRERGDGSATVLPRPAVGRVLIEDEMSADLIVVRSVRFQDATQVGLAEHDHVVEAFPPG